MHTTVFCCASLNETSIQIVWLVKLQSIIDISAKIIQYLLTGELNFSLQMLEFQVNKLVFNWTFSEREKIAQRKYQPFFTRNLVKNTKQTSILSCCYFCWVFFLLLLVYKFSSILLSFPILRSHLLSLAFFFSVRSHRTSCCALAAFYVLYIAIAMVRTFT